MEYDRAFQAIASPRSMFSHSTDRREARAIELEKLPKKINDAANCRLFILQDEFVCLVKISQPLEADASYPGLYYSQNPCRSPREIDDATLPKGPAVIYPHFNRFPIG
jgi:hypothetical protein